LGGGEFVIRDSDQRGHGLLAQCLHQPIVYEDDDDNGVRETENYFKISFTHICEHESLIYAQMSYTTYFTGFSHPHPSLHCLYLRLTSTYATDKHTYRLR